MPHLFLSHNQAPVAHAALHGHGLLVFSLVRTWRNPERIAGHLRDDAGALAAQTHMRLTQIRQQSASEDQHSVLLDCMLATGDDIVLSTQVLSPQTIAHTQQPVHMQQNATSVTAAPVTTAVTEKADITQRFFIQMGAQHTLAGLPGHGIISLMVVLADRHPERCRTASGLALPAQESRIRLHAHDTSGAQGMRQLTWPEWTLAQQALHIRLLAQGECDAPAEIKDHD